MSDAESSPQAPAWPEAPLYDQETTEVVKWAEVELKTASDAWRRYGIICPSQDRLLQASPGLLDKLTHLYSAKQKLIHSPHTTPSKIFPGDEGDQSGVLFYKEKGLNAGETMQLVAMPWRALRDNIDNLDKLTEWLGELRHQQDATFANDSIHPELLNAITTNTPLYRHPAEPATLISTSEYLDYMIGNDGDWGIMLMQASDKPGLQALFEKPQSPDELTSDGAEHHTIEDHPVDAIGILEWLCLTLQQNPRQLSSRTIDASWLLANRLDSPIGPLVPYGHWSGSNVVTRLGHASLKSHNLLPRLAVM